MALREALTLVRYASPPRILGVVPAKAGSTRLARKNLRVLGNRPLIGWAADAARETRRFDRLIVSTEDDEMAETAGRHGLEAPFMRPPELAADPVEADGVGLHAVETLAAQGERFDVLALMLPTCPFRTAQDIVDALDLFLARDEPNLMSLAPFDHTPFAAVRVERNGTATPFFPDMFGRSARKHPSAYRPNGAIHVLDVAWFEKSRSYLKGPMVGHVMPRARSIDIDTEEDLRLAARMLAERQ